MCQFIGDIFQSRIHKKDMRYMWRCRGDCRNEAPYFGFMWLADANREPCRTSDIIDSMWMEGCEHQFERYNDSEHHDRNQPLSVRDCVTIFNEFVMENKIRIRTNAHFVNYDDETGAFISMEEFFPNFYADMDAANHIVCIICFEVVAEENVIEHLCKCTGLTFSWYQSLPILMINKSNQN